MMGPHLPTALGSVVLAAHEVSEMQSGPLVVADTDSAVESYKPDLRKKMTQESPFKVPENDSIFLFRIKEKEARKEEQRRYLSLPVHQKLSYAGRMTAKQRALQTELSQGPEEEEGEEKTERSDRLTGQRARPGSLRGNNPSLRIALIKGENVEKESTRDYLNRKREMFLLEYSLMVKRSEITKLEDATAAEEKRLTRAERVLENDTLLFEEFLKENDKNSVEAIKIAEQETKSKLEKMAEIKRLTSEMVTIKSDISKNEEILKEYSMYKDFLFKLSPPEWQDAHRVQASKGRSDKDAQASREKDRETEIKSGRTRGLERKTSGAVRELPPIRDSRASSRLSAKSPMQSDKLIRVSKLESDDSEYEDEPQLYFSEPQQLLDLLTELEEQNLSLIQNSRETEEALEELRHTMESSKTKMAQDAEQLTAQIDIMTQTITREEERAADLELKARLFDFGRMQTGDQDNMLDALSRKVEEVYCCCVGDKKSSSLSTLQMLANIESRLSVLLESIESIPTDVLEKVERIKDRERRIRQRDEKLQQKKVHQEERLKKALQRSQADVKKTSGKKLMSRSQPASRKIKFNNVNSISEQDELHAYFFT